MAPPDKGGSGGSFPTRVLEVGIPQDQLTFFQTQYDEAKESLWDKGWQVLKDLHPHIFQGGLLRAQDRPGREHDRAGFCCRLTDSTDQCADPSSKTRSDVNAALLERYGRILQIRIIATVWPLQVIAAPVLEDLHLQGLYQR